jgi:hypothetical protein
MQGEVRISHLNPKNVLVDPDADEVDPDTWNDLFITKWVTADDVAVLYGKEDADLLRDQGQNIGPYTFDTVQSLRDRFGPPSQAGYGAGAGYNFSNVTRSIRLIERQYRELDNQKHFVDPATGDMRPVPENFDRDRIALFTEKYGLQVTKKLVKRIRWTVCAGNVVLHDDWSPYQRFTVVPYFPFFRRGTTVGLVENLLSSQELLNKTSSQELHIVNTTANSGWKVKAGAVTNMTPEELEARGAETGLVIETNGDPDRDIVKIQPNSVPSGLDRISYKAEEHIKGISGVSDSQQGFDREDVAAKAIQTKRQASATNMAKPLDSLVRSDWLLARHVLDLVQEFYTEERLITITKDKTTGANEELRVNYPNPEPVPDEADEPQESPYEEILNDLTLGEYDVVISSVPQRETLEDSQFEQAMALRQAGVMIPDSVLIESSRLLRKSDILRQMQGDQNTPEAQAASALQQRGQQAQVAKLEGEAAQKAADAALKQAKAQKETIFAQKEANAPIGAEQDSRQVALMQTQASIDLNERRFQSERELALKKFDLEREKVAMDYQLKAEAERMVAAENAVRAAENPQSST